jgi:N-methylhydantoinase A
VRLRAIGITDKPAFAREVLEANDASSGRCGEKSVWGQDGPLLLSLFEREKLRPGATFSGPALIFQFDSTTYIPPGWMAHADAFRNLILTQ